MHCETFCYLLTHVGGYMRQRSIQAIAAAFLCFAFIFAPLSQSFAADASFGWHTASVVEVGITGPNNWFAKLKAEDGTLTRVTFVDSALRKELLAVALTAKSASLKVKALYFKKDKSGCKALYIAE